MQITCSVQNTPNLYPIRQDSVENQISPETRDSPRSNFRKTQIQPRTSNTRIARKKFERVVSSLKKRVGRRGIIFIYELRCRLQIAKNKAAFLPKRIHFRVERILEIFERSPGEKPPRAASVSFSRIPGGVSSWGNGRSQSGCSQFSNSARSSGGSRSMAALISAIVLITGN